VAGFVAKRLGRNRVGIAVRFPLGSHPISRTQAARAGKEKWPSPTSLEGTLAFNVNGPPTFVTHCAEPIVRASRLAQQNDSL
jgi:hypothetical protein